MDEKKLKMVRQVSENTTILDKEQFLKVFLYKIKNLLKRSAFSYYHSIKLVEPNVFITLNMIKEDLKYTIDYSLPVKRNIFLIKEMLIPYYPTFKYIEISTRTVNENEAEKLIYEKGLSVNEALVATIEIKKESTYRIMRILFDKDEIFIKCLEDDKEFRYRMKPRLSASLFLTKIKNKEYNDEYEIGEDFFQNSDYLDTIIHDTNYIPKFNNYKKEN